MRRPSVTQLSTLAGFPQLQGCYDINQEDADEMVSEKSLLACWPPNTNNEESLLRLLKLNDSQLQNKDNYISALKLTFHLAFFHYLLEKSKTITESSVAAINAMMSTAINVIKTSSTPVICYFLRQISNLFKDERLSALMDDTALNDLFDFAFSTCDFDAYNDDLIAHYKDWVRLLDLVSDPDKKSQYAKKLIAASRERFMQLTTYSERSHCLQAIDGSWAKIKNELSQDDVTFLISSHRDIMVDYQQQPSRYQNLPAALQDMLNIVNQLIAQLHHHCTFVIRMIGIGVGLLAFLTFQLQYLTKYVDALLEQTNYLHAQRQRLIEDPDSFSAEERTMLSRTILDALCVYRACDMQELVERFAPLPSMMQYTYRAAVVMATVGLFGITARWLRQPTGPVAPPLPEWVSELEAEMTHQPAFTH